MTGLSLPQRRALAAWREHPEVGLAVVGDPLRRGQILRAAVAAVEERAPVRWQAASTPLEQVGTGAVCVAAADCLEVAPAVVLADAAAPIVGAPRLEDLHPKLASRCTVVIQADHDPQLSPALIAAVDEAGTDLPLPALPAPGEADPAAVVACLAAFGVTDSRIDVGAGILAGALSGLAREDIDAVLVECVALPRATRIPDTPPAQPEGRADPDEAPPLDGEPAESSEQPRPDEPDPDPQPPEVAPPPPAATLRARNLRRAPAGRRGGTLQPAPHGRTARVVTSERPLARVDMFASLREAARWARPAEPVVVRPEHLRWAYKRRSSGRLTIFVVDVSGSMARDSIRRAKGMALALLDTAYQRRDRVAMVLARGPEATIGMHPTRSSARARAAVRRLPTGGGTPLASALVQAAQLAAAYDPAAVEVICFTDGRTNVPLPGSAPGRASARADAERAALLLREAVGRVEVVDMSRRGRDAAWLRELTR